MPVETVTVDDAIKKGRRHLFYTPLSIICAAAAIYVCSFAFLEDGSIWVAIVGFLGFACVTIIPTVYYFFMLPRWRIWAFSNVRNVHELKERAKLSKIYLDDNSFLWKLEIKTAAQRELIVQLQKKFELPDIFEDDPSIPFETVYAHSMLEQLIVFVAIAACGVGSVIALVNNEILIACVLLTLLVLSGRVIYKRKQVKGPALILSNDGITTSSHGFHSWCDIQNERVFFAGSGSSAYYRLTYSVNGAIIEISLSELTGLDSPKTDHILRTYRGRYEATNRR